ncbi:NUDIX hydrolase [Agarilytica rhodophyticola]|uniref:NUDIX hydrolase n=1 Tax=Agarilytica rhodophyticola TaxID=1737490 RepID=UPI000B348174|nr:CoA pyrophosphatase [Agarilytica rhodophyticola]
MQAEQFRNKAAVLVAIAGEYPDKESLLLTQRAEHLSIHGGEVAFPGGKWEPDDQSLLDTALRESHEEVGLEPSRVQIIDELPANYTRGGMCVSPYVGRVDSTSGLEINLGELQSMFWVPLDFFFEDTRIRTDIFELEGREYWSPAYDWMGYTIWGFTARVIVEVINRVYEKQIRRTNPAPEVIYGK